MNVARLGNKYLTDAEPWKIFKYDPDRVATILNVCLQICANISILAEPFLPFTAEMLRKLLNLDKLSWSQAGKENLLAEGSEIEPAELLFEKIEDEKINQQVQKLLETKQNNSAAEKAQNPMKEPVSFDEFNKLDLRIGQIKSAEKVAKTKKLLNLEVETGLDRRTIISGIAGHFTTEELPGKKVVVLMNLEPREIKGVVSHGMLLLAERPDGKLVFITPELDAEVGSGVS